MVGKSAGFQSSQVVVWGNLRYTREEGCKYLGLVRCSFMGRLCGLDLGFSDEALSSLKWVDQRSDAPEESSASRQQNANKRSQKEKINTLSSWP